MFKLTHKPTRVIHGKAHIYRSPAHLLHIQGQIVKAGTAGAVKTDGQFRDRSAVRRFDGRSCHFLPLRITGHDWRIHCGTHGLFLAVGKNDSQACAGCLLRLDPAAHGIGAVGAHWKTLAPAGEPILGIGYLDAHAASVCGFRADGEVRLAALDPRHWTIGNRWFRCGVTHGEGSAK